MAAAGSRGEARRRLAPGRPPASEGEPAGLLEKMFQEGPETSSMFFKNGVRDRMKEKKNGVFKTAKINASLASKIRTRTINNSSIIKVSLKQNNKALALALNAAKIAAQKLTDDKMWLQKEVELGHFENACLRQKLSSVKKCIDEMQLLMNNCFQAAIKLTSFSESDSFSSLLDERGKKDTQDISCSQDDSNCLREAPKFMRIPLSHADDEGSGSGRKTSTSLEKFPLDPLESVFGEPLRNTPFHEGKNSFASFTDKLLAESGNSDPGLHGMDDSTLALNSSTIFGENLGNVPPYSRPCSLSILDKNYPVHQCKDTARSHSDSILSVHVTKRKKGRTGLPATFGNDLEAEISDVANLQGPKETENLEISQVAKLIIPGTKRENRIEIKAKETKTLGKDNAETKNRFSSSQSKLILNDGHNGRPDINVAVSKTSELNSGKIKLPTSACWVENVDKDRKEERSSQPLGRRAARNRRTYVVEPNCINNCMAPAIDKGLFLETMKNLETQSKSPESRPLSSEIQQNETNSCFNIKRLKSKNNRKTIVLAPSNDTNDCAFIQHVKEKTDSENVDSLGRQLQRPESNSLNNVNAEHLFGFQKHVARQEAVSGLNVKRKSRKKVYENSGSHILSEVEEQRFDNIEPGLPQSEVKKKKQRDKIMNVDRNIREVEHADAVESDLNEKAQKGSRKKGRTSKRMPSVFSISLGDEDKFLEGSQVVKKNWDTSATTQKSCSLTKTSSHTETNSNEAGLKKKTTTSRRKTGIVNDLGHRGTDSEAFLQDPEACEIPQANPKKWGFLHVPYCSTSQKPTVAIPEALPLNPDFPSVGLSKNSSDVEVRESPETDCALSVTSTVFRNNITQLESAGREEQQPTQAIPETSSENAALQEDGNKILKDLTNSIPLQTSPIYPSRRRKKDITYAEPSLNKKLRRGDPFTTTDLLSSDIYKTKKKKSTKRTGKSRKPKNIEKLNSA